MEEKESRVRYKFAPPHKVRRIFEDADIGEIIYRGIKYTKEMYIELMALGEFEADKFQGLLDDYGFICYTDFEKIITPEDRFQITFEKLLEDLETMKDGVSYMITLSNTGYSSNKYIIRDAVGNYFEINDNAKSGIHNDIKKYLVGRKQYLPYFTYDISPLNLNMIEPVAKYYYYQEDYENSTSSGAGVLTGWITQEKADRISKGKTLIKLNTNIRLKQKV